MSQHYIISYDITNTPLRSKLALILERYGCERVQKSVFLAPNIETEDLQKLKKDARLLLQTHPGRVLTDSLICFPIKRTDVADMVWEGDTRELRRILDELLFMMV